MNRLCRVCVFFAAILLVDDITAAPDYSRTPVLFVHGHGLDSRNWDVIRYGLVEHNYPPEYLNVVDIVPNTMENIAAAEKVIAPAVESALANARTIAEANGLSDKPLNKIDLVSHSMGAVSSRWYAARLRPGRVRTWISLVGANHGTNTLCDYSDRSAQEMCPAFAENPLQMALNGSTKKLVDETPYGLGKDATGRKQVIADAQRSILYFTIRIEPDEWIQPAVSALLDGAGGMAIDLPGDGVFQETTPGNYLYSGAGKLFTQRADHMSVLYDGNVIALLERLLASRDRFLH